MIRAVLLLLLVPQVALAQYVAPRRLPAQRKQPTLLTVPTPTPEAAQLPVPAAPTTQATAETVAPTDVVGVAFCAIVNSGWNANRWYITRIDDIQQPWPGELLPQVGDASGLCYQTQKKFSFPEGNHKLEIGLVNHCEPGDPDSACQACAAQNGGLSCPDAISPYTPIAVVSTTNPVTCTITVAPTTASVVAAGGTGTVTVTANDPSCAWTVASDQAWLTVTPASGKGSGPVTYTAPATTAGARTGNLLIAGKKVTVTQTGAPCTFTISPTSWAATAAASGNSISVNLTGGGLCDWTASSPVPWAVFTTVSGTDNGVATVSVQANTAAAGRNATLTIAGQPFALTQAGVTSDLCAAGAAEAPTVTLLRVAPSGLRASVPMNPQYQLASKSAITTIITRMNGTIVGQLGPSQAPLTIDGGMWFNAPARGTYTVNIEVVNAYGCHRTSANATVSVK